MLRRFGSCFLLLVILCASGMAAWAQECVPTTASIPGTVLGIAVFESDDPRAIAHLKDLEIEWVRLELRWDEVQKREGEWSWGATDRRLMPLLEHGIGIQMVINHPPVWAHEMNVLPSAFQVFVRAAALRYVPRGVLYWEIFNEPNNPGYGWPFKYDKPEKAFAVYGQILKIANIAIRSVSREAVILNGGLSPDGINPRSFAESFYRTAGKNCFDILALHPYGQAHRLLSVATEAKTLMAQFGDQGKPVWFNEFGLSESSKGEVLELAFAQAPQLDGLFWFSLRDLKRFGWNFGLIEYDWSKKDSYYLFKTLHKNYKLMTAKRK